MIDSVSSIFSPKVKVDIYQRLKQSRFLVIPENGILSSIKKLYLYDLPDNSYAISLDIPVTKFSESEKIQFERLNHYLDKANGLGINKRCDLVLFTEIDGAEGVYIFVLKSSDPDPEDVRNQLVNSEIYIKYILELVKYFYKKDISPIEFHKVIGTTRVRKRVTYANQELRMKLARKNALYEDNNIKEVTVLAGTKQKGTLSFNDIKRLFT